MEVEAKKRKSKGSLTTSRPARKRGTDGGKNRKSRSISQKEAGQQAVELRLLANGLFAAQEEAKRSLARELHDELGQQLTVLRLLLDKMKRSMGENSPPELDEALNQTVVMVRLVRSLSLGLRPGMLDDIGLLATLQWYFQDLTGKTGLRIDFEQVGLERQFAGNINTAVFRAVEEALSNVVRHARASRVSVSARAENSILIILIEDNGEGFDPVALPPDSCGLRSINERCQYLGGRFTVDSARGRGTCLTLEVPFSE